MKLKSTKPNSIIRQLLLFGTLLSLVGCFTAVFAPPQAASGISNNDVKVFYSQINTQAQKHCSGLKNSNYQYCFSEYGGGAAIADCSYSSGCDLVAKYVNPLIDLMSIVFGLIATGSLILGAINYITSEGDPQKSSEAKNRMTNTVFAILAYAFLYGFLQFLVPGGVFNR